MNKLKFNIILFFLLLGIESQAEQSIYHFLRNNYSARSAGLAGCFVAITDDASAVFFNPASVYTVKDKDFSTTFFKHVLDINSGVISYVQRKENFGTLSANVSYTNYGSFNAADKFGVENGTFSANDLSFGATYSNLIDTNIFYGVTLKYVFSNIEKVSSSALAVDAGILYKLKDNRTVLGLSVLNAGMQLSSYQGITENLPLDIRAGISHRLRGLPLLANFSFHHLADPSDNFFDKLKNFSIGGELYIGKVVQLRLGFDNYIRRLTSNDNDKKLSGFAGGVGLKLKDFNFDYGVSMIGSAATLHRFSLGLDL